MRHSTPRSAILRAVGLAAVLAGLLLMSTPAADARGGAAAGAPAANPADGAPFFDQAIRWVNGGRAGIHNLTDFYADLHDVKFNVGASKHEGHMRLWLKTPDKYRIEMRNKRSIQAPDVRITTKILSGNQMWVLHPNRTVQPMHGRPGGQAAIDQMVNDRRRLMDLARFLTLDGLRGPGVTFVNEGFKTGSGTFAGNWIKIRRTIRGGADVTFHLAYQKTATGVAASAPGVVTVEGDPRTGEPTEYYVLKKWVKGPQFNYPSRIEAYSQANPTAPLQPFLLAFPADVRINTKLQSTVFVPPKKP